LSDRVQRRAAFSTQALLFGLPVILALGTLAWRLLPQWSWGGEESGPLVHRVEAGEFIHDITERGEIQSASNVEIRCEVQSRNMSGTTILEIIPEGAYVKEGEILVKLDSSALKTEETQQQIACNTSEAGLIQARNTYETAKIAKQEYLDGKYLQDKQTIEGEILVAKEDERRAKQFLDYSRMLFSKGYVTKLQLEADAFACDKAEMARKTAVTKMKVLEDYTKAKMLVQLESDIKTGEAKLKSEEHSHQLDLEKLALIQGQIEKCVIKAPGPGQVVYANNNERQGGTEIVIQEGSLVRERQVLIRLPDPKNMQVKAKINEAKIALVAVGMPVTIRLDAFPDRDLTGTVEKVNEYPAPTGWFNSSIKEYETRITIDKPTEGMRPGLTAEVKIRVAHLTNVVQVPVQSVLEHGDRHYCLLYRAGNWETREVEIGATNDKFVILRSGVKPGEEVVLGALAYRDKVRLPDLPATQPGPPAALAGGPRGASQPAAPVMAAVVPPAATAKPGEVSKPDLAQLFQRLDKNGNGRLETGELPEPMRDRASLADANGDGALDLTEWTSVARQVGGRRPSGGEPPRGGPPGGKP
jgi:multidrug efflux pump subunit AcrA (membrane-fusion protein)